MTHEIWQEFLFLVMNHDGANIGDGADVDKAHVRANLDLTIAEWAGIPERLEFALIPHDSTSFTVMRQGNLYLVFTASEWLMFVEGVRDKEFDIPQAR